MYICMNEYVNELSNKQGPSSEVIVQNGPPPAAMHGNVKYPFHDLKEVGDYFLLNYAKKRYSIATCLRNYNAKNKTLIRVRTRSTVKGLVVERIADKVPD